MDSSISAKQVSAGLSQANSVNDEERMKESDASLPLLPIWLALPISYSESGLIL